jgi:hypothetical protein
MRGNRLEIFKNCGISEANKPRLPNQQTPVQTQALVQTQRPAQVPTPAPVQVQTPAQVQIPRIATLEQLYQPQRPIGADPSQIHDAASKIQYKELNNFLTQKTGDPMPNYFDPANYIERTIGNMINESYEPENIKRQQRNDLERIMNERLKLYNYDLLGSLKNAIFTCLNYVKLQSPIFKKTYVDTFIKDCINAHGEGLSMSCAEGALERIIFSLLPACFASENNPDCATIVSLIIPIEDFILDWFKLHSPGYSTGSSSSVNEVEPLPEDRAGRRENLKRYLLKKLPNQEEKIEAEIIKWADFTNYDDNYFEYTNKGGRKTMKRRKPNNRKTKKSKTNKNKTKKSKTNKNKTNKNKTNKSKTNKYKKTKNNKSNKTNKSNKSNKHK